MVGQKAATVLLREKSIETPKTFRQRADVQQIDNQKIARLSTFDPDGAGEEVHDRKIDIADVVGGIVVFNEASGPVIGFDNKVVTWFDPRDHRDVGMPAIVNSGILIW